MENVGDTHESGDIGGIGPETDDTDGIDEVGLTGDIDGMVAPDSGDMSVQRI